MSTSTTRILNAVHRDKGGAVFNIAHKDFGADPTGVAAAQTAINAAITAASAAGGGTVFVPRGTFKITGQITLASNVRIVGAGKEQSIFNGTFAGGIGVYASSKTNVAVEGIGFQGLFAMGVVYDTCTKVAARHCSFTGCTSSTHGTGYAGGVAAWVCDDVTIEDNYCSGNGYIGAGLSFDIQINGNGNNTGSERVRIVGNRCLSTATQYGIFALDLQHSEISGNVCTGAKTGAGNNNGYGIITYQTVAMTGAFMRDNRIENNTVYAVGGTGIYVQGVTRTTVVGNAVYDAGAVQDDTTLPVGGISVVNSSDCTVTGNTLTSCQKSGIAVGGTPCEGHVVSGNTIDTVTGIGIAIRGALTRGAVVGNVIKNPSTKGIATLPVSTGIVDSVFADNVVTGSGDRAIDLNGISRSLLRGNVINASGKNGLSLVTGTLNIVEGNVIVDGGTVTTNTYSAIDLSAITASAVRGNTVGNTGAAGYKYGLTIPSTNTGCCVTDNRSAGNLTLNYNVDATVAAGIQFGGNYDSNSTFPQAVAWRQQAIITGAAASITQLLLGDSGASGSVGTRFSGGDTYLATNASHVLGSDLWHQSTAATSKLVILRTNGDIEFYHAANPTADATFATFWGTPSHVFTSAGVLKVKSTTLITSTVAFTNGAAAAAGTLTNAPVAGNPTKWVPIVDNGTTRYIPTW